MAQSESWQIKEPRLSTGLHWTSWGGKSFLFPFLPTQKGRNIQFEIVQFDGGNRA